MSQPTAPASPPHASQRGRPPLPDEHRRTERVEVRITKAQRAKLEGLGGANWIRNHIDAAKERRTESAK